MKEMPRHRIEGAKSGGPISSNGDDAQAMKSAAAAFHRSYNPKAVAPLFGQPDENRRAMWKPLGSGLGGIEPFHASTYPPSFIVRSE